MEYARHSLIKSQDDTAQSWVKFRIYLGVFLFISTALFLAILAWTYRFIRVFGLTKKLTLLFLILVDISALSRVVEYTGVLIWESGKWYDTPDLWEEGAVTWLHATFFSSAVITNIFNWIYQALRIKKFQSGSRKSQIPYHIAFLVSQFLVFTFYATLLITNWSDDHDNPQFDFFGVIYGSTYIWVGITFAIVGVRFYKLIHKTSPDTAKTLKKRLFLSMILICLSFWMRGTSIIVAFSLQNQNRFFIEWLKSNNALLPISFLIFYLVVDIFPKLYLCLEVKWITDKEKRRRICALYSHSNSNCFTEPSFDLMMSLNTEKGDLANQPSV